MWLKPIPLESRLSFHWWVMESVIDRVILNFRLTSVYTYRLNNLCSALKSGGDGVLTFNEASNTRFEWLMIDDDGDGELNGYMAFVVCDIFNLPIKLVALWLIFVFSLLLLLPSSLSLLWFKHWQIHMSFGVYQTLPSWIYTVNPIRLWYTSKWL